MPISTPHFVSSAISSVKATEPIEIAKWSILFVFVLFFIILIGIISGLFSEWDTYNRKVMGGFAIIGWFIFSLLLGLINRGYPWVECIAFVALIVTFTIAAFASWGFETRPTEAEPYDRYSIGNAAIAFLTLTGVAGAIYYGINLAYSPKNA